MQTTYHRPKQSIDPVDGPGGAGVELPALTYLWTGSGPLRDGTLEYFLNGRSIYMGKTMELEPRLLLSRLVARGMSYEVACRIFNAATEAPRP